MFALTDFHPSLTTMENITASGEFELISDIEFRKSKTIKPTINYRQ